MKYQIESGTTNESHVSKVKDWAVLSIALLGWIIFIGLWMYWIDV